MRRRHLVLLGVLVLVAAGAAAAARSASGPPAAGTYHVEGIGDNGNPFNFTIEQRFEPGRIKPGEPFYLYWKATDGEAPYVCDGKSSDYTSPDSNWPLGFWDSYIPRGIPHSPPGEFRDPDLITAQVRSKFRERTGPGAPHGGNSCEYWRIREYWVTGSETRNMKPGCYIEPEQWIEQDVEVELKNIVVTRESGSLPELCVESAPKQACANKQKLAVVLTANGPPTVANNDNLSGGGKCWSFTAARRLPPKIYEPKTLEELFPGSTTTRGFNGCDLSRDNMLWLWDEVNEFSSLQPKKLGRWLSTCKRVTKANAGALYYNYKAWHLPSPFSPSPSLGVKYRFAELYTSTTVGGAAIADWSNSMAPKGFSGTINIGLGTNQDVLGAVREVCKRTTPPLAIGLWYAATASATAGARAKAIAQTLNECTKATPQ